MATIIPQVQLPPIATSMIASMYGVVHTWDDSFTLADLFGYSGHAFILNIERTLCPSGPTAWDWGAILFPLRQLFTLRRLCATCDMRSAEEMRELIWQRTVESIDTGRPSILWDAIYPEFYLAYGYDADSGEYIVQGPGADSVTGRVSWSSLGSNIGQIWALFPAPNDAVNAASARDLALRGAITWHAWSNEPDAQWIFGGDAWQVWIDAMAEEDLPHHSPAVSYNHMVYAECRKYAAEFLTSQGKDYAEAADAYTQVANELTVLCDVWPFMAPVPSLSERRQLSEHLTRARDAEEKGIGALTAILKRDKTARI